jgi:prepilin-type N-terminal cleavage/methylation domain-containing protein
MENKKRIDNGAKLGSALSSQHGFTLLEAIISIAILSFISVFILQIFMSSSGLNKTVRDTDFALAKAVTEIDLFKMHKSIDGYIINSDDALTLTDKNISVIRSYGREWELLESGGEESFRLVANISLSSGNAAGEAGSLYDIEVRVYNHSLREDKQLLVTLGTKKYFYNTDIITEGGM